ncbi:hypothetical protein Dsin_019189 [Dipteronia sinensis]|uniref:Uncharacterized protein n=1 Tax=Dipteronia sinensis TaxID=43782 RepID=A0AAE0A836_9ROSI|nr:hypothetical protein Dsin_019189 [Dipteronia sinensis]
MLERTGNGEPLCVPGIEKGTEKSFCKCGVCETKLHNGEVEKLIVLLGFDGGLQMKSEGQSGGLILLWKDREISVKSFSKGHIDAKICSDNGSVWRFSGLYGSPNPMNRSDSWELLGRVSRVDSLSWVCGRDFNEILRSNENERGADRPIMKAREKGISKDIKRTKYDLERLLGQEERYFSYLFSSSKPSAQDLGDSTSMIDDGMVDNIRQYLGGCKKKEGKRGLIALKVAMSKTYDMRVGEGGWGAKTVFLVQLGIFEGNYFGVRHD